MPDSAPSFLSPPLTLDGLPGHDIRRLHQISVAIFMQETEAFGVTPVQYAALQAVGLQPGIDQRTLARTIGFDTSTIAGVIDRLEARGLLLRQQTPKDRRVKLLHLTESGQELLQALMPIALQAQRHMLDPLSDAERQQFVGLMARVLAHHEGHGHNA